MNLKNIKYEKKESIAYVTMNRPEAMNAFNDDTLDELSAIIDDIENDDSVKAVIFTGSGKAFIAGADISKMPEYSNLKGREVCLKGQAIFSRVENLKIPTIAAVNGFALGGGCEFSMSCDLRIASEYAKFGQPEVNLGIIPGWGGTQRLPRLIGKGRAKYYIYTAEIIKADEAYRIGLVDKLVSADDLLKESEAVAKTIISKAPIAIQLAKKVIDTGIDLPLEAGLSYEAEAYATSFACEDRMEGTTAFLEKREAVFKGK